MDGPFTSKLQSNAVSALGLLGSSDDTGSPGPSSLDKVRRIRRSVAVFRFGKVISARVGGALPYIKDGPLGLTGYTR